MSVAVYATCHVSADTTFCAAAGGGRCHTVGAVGGARGRDIAVRARRGWTAPRASTPAHRPCHHSTLFFPIPSTLPM